jgi:hypothetical protein
MNRSSGISILTAAFVLSLAIRAPAIGSNPTDLPPTNSAPVEKTGPLLKMDGVPITTASEVLARQASINYLLAPQLEKKWRRSGEPIVNFALRNVVAKDVLRQILTLHHLALMEDPASNIALIIPADQTANPLFAGMATSSFSLQTNIIPLIQFEDVPFTTAIENLARQTGVNYMLDPNISRHWDGSSAAHLVPEPQLSLRLEKVTCWAALNRLLNVYGLVLVEHPRIQIARIAVAGDPSPHVDTSLLDSETNSSFLNSNRVPLIQFSDVPLDTVLANLVRQCPEKIAIDRRLVESKEAWKCINDGRIPMVGDDTDKTHPAQMWFDPLPVLFIRWENLTPAQAIVSLCENYGLVIIKDDSTGIFQIEPNEALRLLHPQP